VALWRLNNGSKFNVPPTLPDDAEISTGPDIQRVQHLMKGNRAAGGL
jgi:hypothetical protein